MVQWLYYPKARRQSLLTAAVVGAFETEAQAIDSATHDLRSADVLARVEPHLTQVGFQVENGSKTEGPVLIPVLMGRGGKVRKYFHADAYHEDQGFVVEVEAGRGVSHNQFLKDLFQACLMYGVDYVAIAVRNRNKDENDFEKVSQFLEVLYASERLKMPLKGVLLIGY